ncbi:uncharacterized protein LOC105221098 [Zeugodacus cucurbitae]|uniref:uncharacterized protein LOC105221098 n=1 Tax=Zeugodacus cucurbitae TaxID=28588 RepID=UPI0023D937A4|nr:uncharacterized protein LOC105221098 [Zeugodacus cucurbitae]XP_028901962.2 uncharacterized protein LOC105221098 [Zeugodacus cucurbitae]
MTRSTISCLLLYFFILCCLYEDLKAADEDDDAFTLVFGSESSLEDVQQEINDAKETLTEVLRSFIHLFEDYDSFVKRFDKLDTAQSKQNGNLQKQLETIIEESLALQSTELTQQLMTEPKWLQDQMSAELNSFIDELQKSENKLLVKN